MGSLLCAPTCTWGAAGGGPDPTTPPPHPHTHLLPQQDALLHVGCVPLGLLASHLLPQHLGLSLCTLQRALQLRHLLLQPLQREAGGQGKGSHCCPPPPPGRGSPPHCTPTRTVTSPLLSMSCSIFASCCFTTSCSSFSFCRVREWGQAVPPHPDGTLAFEVTQILLSQIPAQPSLALPWPSSGEGGLTCSLPCSTLFSLAMVAACASIRSWLSVVTSSSWSCRSELEGGRTQWG